MAVAPSKPRSRRRLAWPHRFALHGNRVWRRTLCVAAPLTFGLRFTLSPIVHRAGVLRLAARTRLRRLQALVRAPAHSLRSSGSGRRRLTAVAIGGQVLADVVRRERRADGQARLRRAAHRLHECRNAHTARAAVPHSTNVRSCRSVDALPRTAADRCAVPFCCATALRRRP